VVEIREVGEADEGVADADEAEVTEAEGPEDGAEKGESDEGSSGGEKMPEDTAEEEPVQVRCPCCGEPFALQNLLLAQTGEHLGSKVASAILADGSIREPADSAGGMKLNFGGGPAVDHSDFRLEPVEARPTPSVGAFEFAAPASVDTDREGKPDSGRTRRQRRPRGGMKDLVGAIVGGAAGLLITYYLLNLIGGPRFDMFHVYLPGVKHTTVHRPNWLGGPPDKEFDSGLRDVMGMGTPEPKPEKPKPQSNGNKKPDGAPAVKEPDVEPMPSEEALPADYVGLLHPPQATSDELGQTLREVDRLAKAGPLTEEGYEQWCRVAEAATFIDRVDGNPQTQGRLDAMHRLLKNLTVDDVKTIGRLATRRTLNPDRASHGILLAGTAHNPNTPAGKGFVTALGVADTGAQVVIASDRKLPIQPEDRILVLGYLVDQPENTTQGLDTDLPQIIWVRTIAKFGR
jgi:hypothetical protein